MASPSFSSVLFSLSLSSPSRRNGLGKLLSDISSLSLHITIEEKNKRESDGEGDLGDWMRVEHEGILSFFSLSFFSVSKNLFFYSGGFSTQNGGN